MTNETDDLLNDLLGAATPAAPVVTPVAPEPTPVAPKKAKAKKAAKPKPEPAPEPEFVQVAAPKPVVFVAQVEDMPDWTPPPVVEAAVEVEVAPVVPAKIDHSKRDENDWSHLSPDQRQRLEAEQRAGRGY